MDTRKLAAFVAAVDAGSLSSGATRLAAKLSTVSRRIAELEASLGVALLVRNGRGVAPTSAGSRFLAHARVVLRELDAAQAALRDPAPTMPVVRLSSPPDIAREVLPAILEQLAVEHRELVIDARTDVRRVSLLEEEYDAAIRLGPLDDSQLVARRLGLVSRLVCAAPGAVPRPSSARAFDELEKVAVHGIPTEIVLRLRGRSERVQYDARIRVATFGEAAEIAARSQRVVILPSFTALRFLRERRLVQILPPHALAPVALQLVSTPRHRGAPLLRRLAVLLTGALATVETGVAAFRGKSSTR